MKRRNAECGKLRRPIKRNKITDGMSSTTILYLKFLILWAIVITADFMFMVRFEFLWPFWMLLRSVHDSFKYKGLAFSVLFVCIAITSDLICLFFIPVNWLLFAASTYVWVQYVWHTDKGICLPTIILWMLFVYLEAGIRWKDSRHMPHLDLCRPFAAHCIGYPVVTLGFGFKSYVGYRMRQRKQREVAKENEFYMQLLQQALPQDETVNSTVNSNVSISNSLLNSTPSALSSDELSIRLHNGCVGHQPKLPTSVAMPSTIASTTSSTIVTTTASKDDVSTSTFFSSCSSTSSSSSSSSSSSTSSLLLSTTATSTSLNSNSVLSSSSNNNNNSSSKSAAQNKLNYNVCNNSNSITVTTTSNGHVKNRRNNHDKTNSSSSQPIQNGKIYQQIKDLKEVNSSQNHNQNSTSSTNVASSSHPSSKNHYENYNGSTNNTKKNQHQNGNGSLPKGISSSSDYQMNETASPHPPPSEKPRKKKSKKNDSINHQNKEKDNHQNNNSQHSKDLNSDTSSISSSTSSSTSTLTNLASHVVNKICDACLKFEADIMKYRSEISQMKQIENDLRQKLDSSNQQVKSCLQAKQKECESLETRLQNIKSLRKTEQNNYTELERTLREEQRKRQSLEAQLQNEKVARLKAEDKAQMNNHRMDCSDQCKQKRQQLDTEVKRLRREIKAAEEAKIVSDQQSKRAEQKFAMFEQEIRSREPQSKMLMAALNAMQDKNVNLEKNLSAETRVKLDLFSALGEAKRQIEIKNSLLYSRQEEVQELKAKIAELLAVLPSDNLCLPSSSNGPSSPLLNLSAVHQQLLSSHQLNQRVNGEYLPPPQPQTLQSQQTTHTPTSSGGNDA